MSHTDRCPYCGVEVEDASDCERPADVCCHDTDTQTPQVQLLRDRNASLRSENEQLSVQIAKLRRVIAAQAEEIRLLRYSVTKYSGA